MSDLASLALSTRDETVEFNKELTEFISLRVFALSNYENV